MAQTIIGQTPAPVIKETILPESYRHTIVDSVYTPHTSMLTFVPGEPTLTEYYRGGYGTDEEQLGFQPDSIETYQSYKRINNFIMKIDDGRGSYNFNPENAQSVHILQGYVLFDIAPNIGDLFIKDIGDGKAGLYMVNVQPEVMTIHSDKCYRIEAELQCEVTAQIYEYLTRQVIEELYYSKDSAVGGGNAVLTKTDFNLNSRLYDMMAAIIDDILGNYYFSDENTIVIPNADKDLLYDPYLARFLSYVIPHDMLGPRDKIETLSVQYYTGDRKQQEPVTIWDMFYRGDFSQPKRYKQEFYTHTRSSLINTRYYGNVFFSKMDRAILVHKAGASRFPYQYTGAVVPIGPQTIAPPNPEGTPHNYFFGDDFYEFGGTETQQFVWKMFKDKTVDKAGVMKVMEGYWNLDELNKLYMAGIYIGAIKTALLTNSQYT